MQAVDSKYPPGAVLLITGDLARYSHSLVCVHNLQVPVDSAFMWFTGCGIAHNLNTGIAEMLKNSLFQWLWIGGDDHMFESDLVLRLLARDKDIVVPLCLNRVLPIEPPIQTDTLTGRQLKALEDMPTSGLYKLEHTETCGDAGMLVKRSVLEKMTPPWYSAPSGAFSIEDQQFTDRLRKEGNDIYIDCDNTYGHIGQAIYTPVVRNGRWVINISTIHGPVVEFTRRRKQWIHRP